MPHSETESPASPVATPSNPETKVWAGLISSADYLPGLLTLEHSLRRAGSKYKFIALYPDILPEEAHAVLDERGIAKRKVPYLSPTTTWDAGEEVRFNDVWTKLTIFSMVEYEKVVLLDLDMLVMRNMDELMDVELDDTKRLFAATPLCVCNPSKSPVASGTWPSSINDIKGGFWNWSPEECAFTHQHANPSKCHLDGPPVVGGTAGPMPNAGLIVARPSLPVYARMLAGLATPSLIEKCTFPEQDLLKYLFPDRWVSLPYVYNAIKSMRWDAVHDTIWQDDQVKNLHFIGRVKPWRETPELIADPNRDPTHQWWWDANALRIADETALGLVQP